MVSSLLLSAKFLLSFPNDPYKTEMPTSGDLKSDSLIFTIPPPHPPNFNWPPSPRQIDPAANGNGLGHYMSVLHELYAIKIRDHLLDAKIILSVTKCVQKCLRNRTTNKKIQILGEKWAKPQTISKEKYKRCLVREICWPIPERGRSVSYRESWHMCRTLGVIHCTRSLLVWPPGTGREARSQKWKYSGRQLA